MNQICIYIIILSLYSKQNYFRKCLILYKYCANNQTGNVTKNISVGRNIFELVDFVQIDFC